jgi:hypothetical protein
MDNWKDLAIGALIAQAIGSVWFYLRSIGNKVNKEDFEKAMTALAVGQKEGITALNTDHATAVASLKAEQEKAVASLKAEIDKTNAEMKSFARQGTLDEVKSDFRRLETKIDAKLDTIQQQLLTLLARDHK